MKKIVKITAIATLLGASASASAWWGGPGYGSFMDDFFGDGFGDFNMSANTSTRGWGRGYGHNYYAPYYGYAPYGYGVPYGYGAAPVAPVAQAPVAATAK